MNGQETYHVPVLLNESVEGLSIRPSGTYVDVTFGGGGHSKAILERMGEKGKLFGFDQDEDAEKNSFSDEKFTFVRSNFRYLSHFLDWYGIEQIDGLLADLGVSSHHFDDKNRGFSFRFDGELDMRMNRRAEKTAADVLNTYPEEALSAIFFWYGELRNARAISRAIVQFRSGQKIQTSQNLINILSPFFEKEKEKKQLAQAFQALRIEVNGEMDALKDLLVQAGRMLKTRGRLVVITYHSLEDRLVKNFFKSGNFEGVIEKDFFGNIQTPFKLINNKVIIPDGEEMERNPRSRSAKLRIAEKKA